MASSSNLGSVEQTVENDDDRSRLRVSKACSRCRVRKDRCDGLKPCTSCRNANKPCTYEITTKKRGLPEGYVRGLEKLTTLACQTIDGLEEVLVSYLKDEEVQKTWNTTDELYTAWKESGVQQQLEEFLQITTSASSGGTKRKRAEDTSSDNSPAESLDTIIENLRNKGHRVSSSNQVESFVGAEHEVVNGQADEELPANSKELLDVYFTNVHCWFPIVERPAVLKAFYGSRRAPERLLDGGKALLWAIFAYAVMLDPSVPGKNELSQRWSENSLKHIPTPYTNAEDVQDFDIMQAQALIILSLLRLGNGQWLGAWMCTGRAARILLAKSAGSSKSRKGALQGCFIVESLLNVHFMNAQPLFPRSLIIDMIEEDGHEEWECWGTNFDSPSFALSTFNRLTNVFLILHEALTDPVASKEPSFVRSRLTSVHALAQEHFGVGIGSPTVHSPPHHVYFQIGLLFAQLRMVSQLSERDASQFDLSSLSTNVLGLFEICEKSTHIGLTRVPPLFADILNLAIKVAAESRNSFGLSAASPSYQDFVVTISDFRNRLANIWDTFRSKESPPDDSASYPRQSHSRGEHSVSEPVPTYDPQSFDQPDALLIEVLSNPPDNMTTGAHSRESVQGQWTPSAGNMPSPAVYQQQRQNSWQTFPAVQSNAGFPIPSPSFAGDEVDAIFHEMAHLDTNEWTNERAVGLKDFGFTDESAFMEFCNDPERLAMAPLDGNMPLSSNRQSWNFATQPP